MYSTKPSFVYGFHGIDRAAAIRILNQEDKGAKLQLLAISR